MEVKYERCCGIDVHKKTVVACAILPGSDGQPVKETRTFDTMMADLEALSRWLSECRVTHVAMESTGVYWKPVYNLLDGRFEVLVVNAEHVKALSGRKTDVADAEWIADLLRHGLLKGSFIPSALLRELRDLTRYRTKLGDERKSEVNRLQKVLEDANIKLASVASDVMGVSGRAILNELVAGHTDPALLAGLAKGRLREKQDLLEKALRGTLKDHHRFMLAQHLSHIDFLDEAIERLDAQIGEQMRPFEATIQRWDSLPGINRRIAEIVIAEVGADLKPFEDADHLASWAGMCPGNNKSAGKRFSGKTRKGSKWLRRALIEAAHGAAHTKEKYFQAQYRRLAARRGKQRAAVAVGHSLLVIGYNLITRQETYQDLGANYFDERDREAVKRRAVRRLEKLGFQVQLSTTAALAIP
jgi:transposase